MRYIASPAYFLTIDPSLGRLDANALSDQTLMEILIDGMIDEDKADFQDDSGNFFDVCEWKIIQCVGDRVMHISMATYEFGTVPLPFGFIPPLAERFSATYANLHGTLETSCLPAELRTFEAAENKLHGPLNFKMFPRTLAMLVIESNEFCGSCRLADLPDTLTAFIGSGNNFTGEISLNSLPQAMEKLDLARNALTGSLSIETLPSGIKEIHLSRNNFFGDFKLLAFPDALREIHINGNQLSATAIFRHSSEDMPFELDCDPITEVLDAKGNTHPWEEEFKERFYLKGM